MTKFEVTLIEHVLYERKLQIEAKTSFDAVREAIRLKDTVKERETMRDLECTTCLIPETEKEEKFPA